MKDIPGYEGLYAVTEDGRVWAHPRQRSSKYGKWMKLQIMRNPRKRSKSHDQYTVGLFKNSTRKMFQVHRLVALTYIENIDSKSQINHKDGNPLNNNVNNLEWVTPKQNMQHAIANGLFDIHSGKQDQTRSKNGKKTGAINGMKSRRMFSMSEVDCIRKIHEVGKKSCRAISRAYNCADKTILNICSYKTYLQEIPQ